MLDRVPHSRILPIGISAAATATAAFDFLLQTIIAFIWIEKPLGGPDSTDGEIIFHAGPVDASPLRLPACIIESKFAITADTSCGIESCVLIVPRHAATETTCRRQGHQDHREDGEKSDDFHDVV